MKYGTFGLTDAHVAPVLVHTRLSLQRPIPGLPGMSNHDAEKPLSAADQGEARAVAEWFYAQRGVMYGPVTSIDLRAAAHLGFLGPEDLVRRSDRGTWVAARSIRGLFKETA